MRIFPIRLVSGFERLRDLYKIIDSQHPVKMKSIDSDVITLSKDKPLVKGRSICNMLSE